MHLVKAQVDENLQEFDHEVVAKALERMRSQFKFQQWHVGNQTISGVDQISELLFELLYS